VGPGQQTNQLLIDQLGGDLAYRRIAVDGSEDSSAAALFDRLDSQFSDSGRSQVENRELALLIPRGQGPALHKWVNGYWSYSDQYNREKADYTTAYNKALGEYQNAFNVFQSNQQGQLNPNLAAAGLGRAFDLLRQEGGAADGCRLPAEERRGQCPHQGGVRGRGRGCLVCAGVQGKGSGRDRRSFGL
jgi:hypothetical protein